MTDKTISKTRTKGKIVVKRTEEPPKSALVQVQLGDGKKMSKSKKKKKPTRTEEPPKSALVDLKKHASPLRERKNNDLKK